MLIVEEAYTWAWTPAERTVTTHLILHHAAVIRASAQEIHNWHITLGWAGIAYNYYIRKNGAIFRGRPENIRGAHTSEMNGVSVGICFEGNFDVELMTHTQITAGCCLIGDIRNHYPGVIIARHSDYQSTNCPGVLFPFDEITAVFMHGGY